jgi:hypothetical protein
MVPPTGPEPVNPVILRLVRREPTSIVQILGAAEPLRIFADPRTSQIGVSSASSSFLVNTPPWIEASEPSPTMRLELGLPTPIRHQLFEREFQMSAAGRKRTFSRGTQREIIRVSGRLPSRRIAIAPEEMSAAIGSLNRCSTSGHLNQKPPAYEHNHVDKATVREKFTLTKSTLILALYRSLRVSPIRPQSVPARLR